MHAELIEKSGRHGTEVLEFSNHEWSLRVELSPQLSPVSLVNLSRGEPVADERYCYQFTVGGTADHGFTSAPQACRGVTTLGWSTGQDEDSTRLILRGRCDFGPRGPMDVELEHVFRLHDSDDRLDESIALIHRSGHDIHPISDLRFAFRKTLYDRQEETWRDHANAKRLTAVPFRRKVGQITDHRMTSYTAADLIPVNWGSAQLDLPARSAEAWLWGDDAGGYLAAKYTQDHIEFGVAEGALVEAIDTRAQTETHIHIPAGRNLCLQFGGAAFAEGEPEEAMQLEPRSRIQFGTTTLCRYDGDWQGGYAKYKSLLALRGHTRPGGYGARVHWNELYNLGWRGGSNAPLQELPQLWREAELARDAGAQTFYFDPGWDLYEGSAVWDTERLGDLGEFIHRLRADYGLELALHLMMHTKATDDDPAIYRRGPEGELRIWHDKRDLYSGGYICAASPAWQEQKIERLSALADAGTSFFMFDFLNYRGTNHVHREERDLDESACWSSEHGHSVPLTRRDHAEGILAVVREIKRRYPHVVIEAHDRISGGLNDYLPLYFQHGGPDSYDEIWGFEYMWDPFSDLLSGKALSLYEYNLAYDIPLYLHINNAHDNQNMLAFWWYASTCRHLGTGGLQPGQDLWEPFTAAMATYRRLQDHFVTGEFVGIDERTHVHVLRDDESAVLTAFNFSDEPETRVVKVPAAAVGTAELRSARGGQAVAGGDGIEISVTVAPLSCSVVELNVPE